MATESADDRREHLRGITVTSIAAFAGIAAAVISTITTAGMAPEAAATARTPQYVVAGAILVQIPLVQWLDFYDDDEFGAKEALFIAFMTFSMWFVTWGILLASGAAF